MRTSLPIFILALWLSFSLSAATFSNLVVFGDSLSDTGNLFNEVAGQGPGPAQNYATGILTDGPATTPASQISGLWDQQLAQLLGLPAPLASTSGGTNYAYAGAETGSGTAILTLDGLSIPVPNMNVQVANFLSATGGTAPASSLYAIWGGSNDILNNAAAYFASNTPSNLATLESTPATLISNEVSNIQTLYSAGARDFLLFDVPNLGATPQALALSANDQAALTALSAQTELDFMAAVAQLDAAYPGIDVIPVDAFAQDLAVEAAPAAFGLTNITTPAQGLTGVNPDQYLYWDSLHPTTKGHQIVAGLADRAILADAPEPSSYALAASALLMALLVLARRSA